MKLVIKAVKLVNILLVSVLHVPLVKVYIKILVLPRVTLIISKKL